MIQKVWIGFLVVIVGAVLVACSSGESVTQVPVVDDDVSEDVGGLSLGGVDALPTPSHPGEVNYNTLCAHCHGYDGEGQLDSTIENTRSLGMKTVPPHNADGHTWEHATPLLVEAIQNGIDNPLNHYVMSGFGNVLTEQDILDIIDYMRGWWTEDQREYQAEVTRRYLEVNGE